MLISDIIPYERNARHNDTQTSFNRPKWRIFISDLR